MYEVEPKTSDTRVAGGLDDSTCVCAAIEVFIPLRIMIASGLLS
jgi:hypothetical protein